MTRLSFKVVVSSRELAFFNNRMKKSNGSGTSRQLGYVTNYISMETAED